MKTVQIGDVPDDVYRRLAARAASEGRSLSEFALAELRRSLERPTRGDLLERIQARAPVIVSEPPADANDGMDSFRRPMPAGNVRVTSSTPGATRGNL